MVNEKSDGIDTAEAPYSQYLDHLRQGKISYQECCSCSASIFYPRTICPECGSTDLRISISSGHGTVYSSTDVYRGDGDIFNVVLVDLEEGIRVMSTLVPRPAHDPIGLEVQLSADPTALRTIATIVEQEHGA